MKRIINGIVLILVLMFVLHILVWNFVFHKEPEITSGEFPMLLEYEMNGERYVIEDVVVCSYDGMDTTSLYPTRKYSESLKSGSNLALLSFEENTESVLVEGRINEESSVRLSLGDGGYYLGDHKLKEATPYIAYYETYKNEPKVTYKDFYTILSNEQLETLFGIKIIRFEFSSPIQNTFE